MSIIFDPSGTLDVSTEPVDLKDIDLQRCKNLVVERDGYLETRDGHSRLNETAIDFDVDFIIEHKGARYEFSADEIYRNEVSIWP